MMSMQSALKPTKSPAPVYLELEVGGKSNDELLAELKSGGFYTSLWAKDIMSNPAFKLGERQTVKFARVTVRELGFTKRPNTTQVGARILELGHSLCEPADGPAIRLVLKDQKRGDHFCCAMEQILGSDGMPRVFHVLRNAEGRELLSTLWAHPNDELELDDSIMFRLRK
jgi:hypothetical protein